MFEQLGVRPLINAATSLTALGGSLMPPEVLDAMRSASSAFVDMAERTLAEQYGVSKTPVREALRDLARRGLITFHPYKGTVVTELSLSDAKQIFEVRLLLEPHAVQLAVPHHDAESLAKCQQALEAADTAGSKHGDLAEERHMAQRAERARQDPGRGQQRQRHGRRPAPGAHRQVLRQDRRRGVV